MIELYHDLHDSVSISQRLATADVTTAKLGIDIFAFTGSVLHCNKSV